MVSPSRPQPLLGFLLQVSVCIFLSLFFLRFLESAPQDSSFQIVNAHEHMASLSAAKIYQKAARAQGITHTVLLGSPEAALEPGKKGFLGVDENNEKMLRLARRDPSRYSFFAAIDPDDPLKLSKLTSYVRQGAKGLKLYSGHSAYHRGPLDDAAMFPVFEFCENRNIPVVFHVNPALYQNEFESILNRYPNLKVVCPHYCLSTIRVDRFEELMDRHPNLYTDTSFGFLDYFKEGLLRFSSNPERYRQLMLRYQDRILFGLDLVVNGEGYKGQEWLGSMMRAYRDLLEKSEFTTPEIPGLTLHGLNLERVVLRKIYKANFQRLMRDKAL